MYGFKNIVLKLIDCGEFIIAEELVKVCSATKELEYLEDLIKKHSLKFLLSRIEEICRYNSGHLRSVWHDESYAKSWDRDADILSGIIAKIKN